MNSYLPSNKIVGELSICHMMNIKFWEKSNEKFYHFKCYVIRDAYHMLPATYRLVRV